MADTDIVARLQLRAEQFSSETGKQFADLKTRARSAAQDVRSSFNDSFSEVQKLAQNALTLPRTTGGSLDLSSEIAQLKTAASASEQRATALRELSIAQTAAAQGARDGAQALHLEADASGVAAIAAEQDAQAIRDRIAALHAVQGELNKTTSSTRALTEEEKRHVVSSGQARASAINLGQQFQDFSVQVLSGTSAFTAFAQQAPQAGFALSGFKGKLGAVGAFLTGPWGVAITIGVSALGILGKKLFETGEAAEAAKIGASGLADAQSVLGGVFDNVSGKLNRQNELLILNARLTAINLRADALKEKASSQKAFADAGRQSLGDRLRGALDNPANPLIGFATGSGRGAQNARNLQGVVDDVRGGRTTAEAALKASAKIDFTGTKIEREKFQQAIIDAAASQAKGKIADLVDKSLDDGKLATGLRTATKATGGSGRSGGSSRSDGGQSTSAAAARAAEQLANRQNDAQDRIANIRGRFDDQPRLVDQTQAANRALDDEIEKYGKLSDAVSKAIVAKAQDAKLVVAQAPAKPFNDLVDAQERSLSLQRLVLQGRDAEAAALSEQYRLMDQLGVATSEQLQDVLQAAGVQRDVVGTLREQAVAQQRVADAIEDQRREIGLYLGVVDDVQRSFETFYATLQRGKIGAAGKGLFSDLLGSFRGLDTRLLSEKLFGGLDREIERLLRGKSPIEKAQDYVAAQTTKVGGSLDRFVGAVDGAATRLSAARPSVTAGIGPQAMPVLTPITVAAPAVSELVKLLRQGNGSSTVGGASASPELVKALQQGNGNDDIVVTASRANTEALLGAKDAFNLIGGKLVDRLGSLGIKLPKVLSDELSKSLGTYLQGAALGSASGKLGTGALGIKGSDTGAAIGGALGQKGGELLKGAITATFGKTLGSFAGPIGGIVGGFLGSAIGGLFKKVEKGSSTLGFDQSGGLGATNVTGSNAAQKAQAGNLAGSVASSLQQIADAVGGKLTGKIGVSIGQYDGKYVVDTQGLGRTKLGIRGDNVLPYKTEQEAVAAALRDALQDGVIEGISAASKKIIQAGGDLQKAIEKATLIESIPKQLKALTDPVGAAVDDLNDKFRKVFDALKEGGGTAEQFAQAQQLYALQLADVKINTQNAGNSLTSFLDSLKFGNSSPLSLRDQESAAKDALKPYLDQIGSGQAIDQGKYQAAAQAYLDIERQLNGSTGAYFAEFDKIQAATAKAIERIDNAVSIAPTAANPFAEATAKATQATAEIGAQTNELLGQAVNLLQQAVAYSPSTGSSFIGAARNFTGQIAA